ncbi:DEAD/DEAH box helicase [Evansella clarkii]|uniref:DEAD/DEAH box helicase n=1 Tax=Evansella clarkii TaxID=79879 RepID=UPI0009962FAF|nr:helicase-related protein [Evansella clarkii]
MDIGDVISSSFFPEPVKIKKCDPIAEYFIIEAIGEETNKYYELLIEQEKMKKLYRVEDNEQNNVNTEDLQNYIQYRMLKNNLKFSNSRALENENIMPLPHQIEAVYGRMLQVPQIRFLLADDPGAGKTIMAGMLMKELISRFNSQRILILVPPLVLKQWQEELEQKFSINFHIVNRTILKEYGRKNPFIKHPFVLTSMYWAIRDDVRPLIQEANYDLIIVDEAHKMAAYTQGTAKKKVFRTKLYQLGEFILQKASHVLLLTATPHKGDSENFRHLMKLIDEDVFNSSSVNESIREKSNPFIIRRLKENLKNFDGSPIFPKRTTKTIQFELTEGELDLYESVTNYVSQYFNKAINNGSESTAFAMMLLQRRLSSSLDAIYLSLKRRYARLVSLYKQTETERKRYLNKLKRIETEHYLEEGNEYQEEVERKLELSTDEINLKELKKEILVLKGLIKQAEHIKFYEVEKKYQELEETLFGLNGLLQQNEKIIIFTESIDTLNYLEEKLLKRVSIVAKIIGGSSMEKRRQQVELFRNNCQIMLATDAGGESINLQFCNQMINYDIPWNPNKLEQRMGRIHRIGQMNEVFVFNLVAKNTREGSVMAKLLDKIEQMRTDLGSDLVYDFMGEIIEDNYDSLAEIMQKAIIERERLDEILENMDKTLTNEHEKLLELLKEERMAEEDLDLSALKKQKENLIVNRVPPMSYTNFTTHVLNKKKVRIAKSKDKKVFRIERLPKFIREQMGDYNEYHEGSYHFTNSIKKATEQTPLISESHPLFITAMKLIDQKMKGQSWSHYKVSTNIPENIYVEIYEISVTDGTGKTLENQLIHLAQRKSGDIITLDPNWIFYHQLLDEVTQLNANNKKELLNDIISNAMEIRDEIASKRESQLNKLHIFLEKSFNHQYRETLNRLDSYQQENVDNRNTALINQMNSKLIEIDNKKEERLELVNRQRNVSLKPPKKILSLQILSQGKCKRVIASDYTEAIIKYERANGRMNVKQYNNLGLVDFSSERFNGEERFIILTNDPQFEFTEYEEEALGDILDKVYIYIVEGGEVKEVRKNK